jgi:hypothetical protein
MLMRKLVVLTASAAILGSVSLAYAGSLGRPCTSAPEANWLSIDALQRKVEEAGFNVKKAKLKNACAEFYVTGKAGDRAELFVDPATGAIVARQ